MSCSSTWPVRNSTSSYSYFSCEIYYHDLCNCVHQTDNQHQKADWACSLIIHDYDTQNPTTKMYFHETFTNNSRGLDPHNPWGNQIEQFSAGTPIVSQGSNGFQPHELTGSTLQSLHEIQQFASWSFHVHKITQPHTNLHIAHLHPTQVNNSTCYSDTQGWHLPCLCNPGKEDMKIHTYRSGSSARMVLNNIRMANWQLWEMKIMTGIAANSNLGRTFSTQHKWEHGYSTALP